MRISDWSSDVCSSDLWLARAGVGNVDPKEGYHFQQGDLAIQAAIRGKGVALANVLMVSDELQAGILVQPFDLSISPPPEYGFYFVSRRSDADQPAIKAFREWVIAEMKLENMGRAPKWGARNEAYGGKLSDETSS